MDLSRSTRLTITSTAILLFACHIDLLATSIQGDEYYKDPTPAELLKLKYDDLDGATLKSMKHRARCFKQYHRAQHKKLEKDCGHEMIYNFCDYVKCEPLKECPKGLTLVQNVVGHECCPACVKFLEHGDQCTPGLVLEQCANGLYCDPGKGSCDVPPDLRACLRDYPNVILLKGRSKLKSGFWVKAEIGPKVMRIEYADEDMELPACSPLTGDYQRKQRLKNKAFCVSPEKGTATFGVGDFSIASKMECKCSSAMYDKLDRIDEPSSSGGGDDWQAERAREQALERLELTKTDHFADTHIKCSPTGDFAEMQCVNETCLCVNEFTGFPLTTKDDWDEYQEKLDEQNADKMLGVDIVDPKTGKVVKSPINIAKEKNLSEEEIKKLQEEEVKKMEEEKKAREKRIPTKEVNSSATVIFGAFKPLVCFDVKRAKEVASNHSKQVYTEDCQDQIHTSMNLQKHFTAKGSLVKGLESKQCGYDDRFARKQCKSGACSCSDPKGTSIGSFGSPQGTSASMDCRCAIERNYVEVERKAFDLLDCDGVGNFNPIQCVGGRSCYCADENGSPISKVFSASRAAVFLKKHAPAHTMDMICAAMRGTMTNDNLWQEDDELHYNTAMKWYDRQPASSRPLEINVEDVTM